MAFKKYGISHQERLKSKKTIDYLFRSGQSNFTYPIKLVYIIQPSVDQVPLRFAVSASKKKIKSAVKRNLLKRRMREAYRLNSLEIKEHFSQKDITVSIMFIYVGRNIESYELIEKGIIQCLSSLQQMYPIT